MEEEIRKQVLEDWKKAHGVEVIGYRTLQSPQFKAAVKDAVLHGMDLIEELQLKPLGGIERGTNTKQLAAIAKACSDGVDDPAMTKAAQKVTREIEAEEKAAKRAEALAKMAKVSKRKAEAARRGVKVEDLPDTDDESDEDVRSEVNSKFEGGFEIAYPVDDQRRLLGLIYQHSDTSARLRR
jgi:hypothetical protein